MRNSFFKKILKNKKFFILLLLVSFLILPIILICCINLKQDVKHSISNTDIVLNSYMKNDEEKPEPWPENPVSEIEFKTLVQQYLPETSNLQELFDWAKTFGVDANSPLPSSAFYEGSILNPNFNWESVGFATTGQFREFLCFYGKKFTNSKGEEHLGLENFKSITFVNTDIEFGLPEFWLSINKYMPNLKTIKIKSDDPLHRSMTKLPAQIGLNRFVKIEIINENIEDNYENFLDYIEQEGSKEKVPCPLLSTLTHLTISGCNLKDHTVKKDDKDQIYYFTDVLFKYYNKSNLLYLDLSKNQLEHIKGNLICLPNLIELRLNQNQISNWHCVDSTGAEISSGIGQICFPNPNGISYINLSNNKLFELVHLKPSEWTKETITQYQKRQEDNYPSLNFLDISNQDVEKNVFIFGNNENAAGESVSDMNIDLSNIYCFPDNLAESDKLEYITLCLDDRISHRGEYGQPNQWASLLLTQNVMPSIINLFKSKTNYVNYYNSQNLQDFSIDNNEPGLGCRAGDEHIEKQVSYYTDSSYGEKPTDSPYYFSTECSSVFTANDYPYGANAFRMYNKNASVEFAGPYASGVSGNYDDFRHSVKITPHYDVTVGAVKDLKQSSYKYNVQIFNSESFVFYLSGLVDIDPESGELRYNDYIKSISDKDISVDDVYNHFWELIKPVGNKNKEEYFKYKFNDREYWNVNFVVNNKVDRILTISVSYPVYQYIGSYDETTLPTKITQNLKVPMCPQADNSLEKLLTIILCIEIGLFIILLIPLIYFFVRTKNKEKVIKLEKDKKIKEGKAIVDKDVPKEKIALTETETKEQKLTFKERFENKINKGDDSKTKTVTVESKSTKQGKTAIDLDDILKELE